jgi:Na+-translocating ferredoxin:NAD+ oxidoreductase RnfD subunit
MFNWLLGGVGSGRVHPVLLTFLLLWVCFPRDLVPHQVLQRNRLVMGDIAEVNLPEQGRVPVQTREPWLELKPTDEAAFWREPASQRLVFFTTGLDKEGGWQSLDGLIRDRMPPLEDLIIGGQPAPIGSASALAVIIGGLFLLYRGLIDWRIPLMMIATAYVIMLIAPIPIVITDLGPTRRWLYATEIGVGWATALTFVHYQILAGPMLFTAFFLATAPAIRPTTRRGCAVFGILAGGGAAICQLYASVSFGAPLAVLLVSMLTPFLDRWIRPRPLV